MCVRAIQHTKHTIKKSLTSIDINLDGHALGQRIINRSLCIYYTLVYRALVFPLKRVSNLKKSQAFSLLGYAAARIFYNAFKRQPIFEPMDIEKISNYVIALELYTTPDHDRTCKAWQ